MIIKELALKNFVCYTYNSNPIQLKFTKGVNIFRGSNGAGKSQLFNAFYWTLYDKMYITNKGWTKGYAVELIPDNLKKSCLEGNSVEIRVTMKIESIFHLNSNINVEYTFDRNIEFTNHKGRFILSKDSELEISYLDELFQTQFVESFENESLINKILPEKIRDYMWFQGETIDELINFNDPNTLRKAVQTLSYYPVYLQLYKICEGAYESISDKINANIKASQKLSKQEEDVLREIDFIQKQIVKNRETQENISICIERAKEKVFEYTQKLSSYDKFPQIEARVKEIEIQDSKTAGEINKLEEDTRSDIINLWMLKGTEHLIEDSIKILKGISQQIQEKSPTKNPIPVKVPGSHYIQQMLDDEMCYICEREAKEGTKEYSAIKSRLNENDKELKEYKEAYKRFIYLEGSYVELANKPHDLLEGIRSIPTEIAEYRQKMKDLFQIRRANLVNKQKVYDELNISESDLNNIKQGSNTAKQFTEKLIFYKDELNKLKNKLLALKENEEGFISNLNTKKTLRKRIQSTTGSRSEYEDAEPYAELLVNATKQLKEEAYERLICEIEKESNKLYQEYLKANTSSKGRIVIDRVNSSVSIEDLDKNPIILSQGLTTAAKMSVINAILFLSTKKMGISYPLIADAPSSVFSSENTQTYTKKIGDTFEQVIIMSKDYTDQELEKLKCESHIANIWLLDNKEIDKNSDDKTRANFKTFITKYK